MRFPFFILMVNVFMMSNCDRSIKKRDVLQFRLHQIVLNKQKHGPCLNVSSKVAAAAATISGQGGDKEQIKASPGQYW